jgi:hypothetical protein
LQSIQTYQQMKLMGYCFHLNKTAHNKKADENQADFSWTIPNESALDKYKLKKRLWVVKAHREL